MLQDMNKVIGEQKELWIRNELMKRHQQDDLTTFQVSNLFEKENYKIEQNGLSFTLFHNGVKISEFKPSLNFSQVSPDGLE